MGALCFSEKKPKTPKKKPKENSDDESEFFTPSVSRGERPRLQLLFKSAGNYRKHANFGC